MTSKFRTKGPREYVKLSNAESQVAFDKLVKVYWGNNPFFKNVKKNEELEVKFGTRGIKPLTKNDYDNVISKLKSLGFTCPLEQGVNMLRIFPQYLDANIGKVIQSPIRAEILGLNAIQQYCKHNDISKLLNSDSIVNSVSFQKKTATKKGTLAGAAAENEKLPSVDFDDFNFRVSYQQEESFSPTSPIIRSMINDWTSSKKIFRYINRVTFTHPSLPILIDISIVKTSSKRGGDRFPTATYTTEESGVFDEREIYEIELEVNNSQIGPGTTCEDPQTLLALMRKSIKYVLSGLQGTNYPISYPEQAEIIREYMTLIYKEEYNPSKWVNNSNFIGPSSYTLQIKNVAPINSNTNIPNIRKGYTVTDKADGDRHLLFISSVGKIYLINTNMSVIFTGAITKDKEVFNTLIDGELILHNKTGQFINLYAAFDIYYVNKADVRAYGFSPPKAAEPVTRYRLTLLQNIISKMNLMAVVSTGPNASDSISPLRLQCKTFYPMSTGIASTDDIFIACNNILSKVRDGLFEYNTDGLIFTPANMGVGADVVGKSGPLKKITWEYSFKWKPPQYNTIDFLVTTQKSATGEDLVTPIFQDGLNMMSTVQMNEYKTIVLRCGFNENEHGYINPCQDVLDDRLLATKSLDDENTNDRAYKPVQFYPTNPTIANAGICHIMLRKDSANNNQMYTEDNAEVFTDNTIVEFKYIVEDLARTGPWRWVPIKVRHDKTTELRQKGNNFGNAYHVANSNWHSIHNPITEEMLMTGQNIPDEIADDDVYYNNKMSSSRTRGLRNFHNLYVKQTLIHSTSRRGDTLIDYACGKGGDLPKWIDAHLAFVFGVDISKDNLENRLDGACARLLNNRKKFKNMPDAIFVNGNSALNIRSGLAMLNDRAIMTTRAVFGQGGNDVERLGKGVSRLYGIGSEGFNVSSCQFAIHYFFESQNTLQNFARNVAECTKLGGYFVGTCYDGKTIFNLLKKKEVGDSEDIIEHDIKLWEIQKDYANKDFNDDVTCLGYKINVYQESINQLLPEYLVNFNYLLRVMENYGFVLINREEARTLGLPEGSGMFKELYVKLQDEIKRNPSKSLEYGDAASMTANERYISFLNRYFVFKKIRNVESEKIVLAAIDETADEAEYERKETVQAKIVAKEEVTKIVVKKPRVKKLAKTITLTGTVDPGPI